jgi:hypothetical protein
MQTDLGMEIVTQTFSTTLVVQETKIIQSSI